MQALRQGIRISPEIVRGLWVTILAAVVGTAGRAIVPIAVQLALDDGINAPGGVDVAYLTQMIAAAALAVVVTGLSTRWMTVRLFERSEGGLATLRVAAFRHVHELSVLTQATESRGALVSRVTGDVDQISRFLVSGGIVAIVSAGQVVVATVIMLFYSPELTLVVWLCFLPLVVSLPFVQRMLAASYAAARRAIGRMTASIAESVVGIGTVRSHAIEQRIEQRIDRSIAEFQAVSTRSQTVSVLVFTSGGLAAGVANALIVLVGIWLGIQGRVTSGEVLAFVFLATLFVAPLQNGVRIITEMQNALAGWKRVIGILDTPVDLTDPGDAGARPPAGPIGIRCRRVGFAYGAGAGSGDDAGAARRALDGIDLCIRPGSRVAVVGETGSGKSTFVRLLARLVDPDEGAVLLNGIDLRDVPNAELRRRVLLVPQEGHLFSGTLLDNVGAERSRDAVRRAAHELGLDGWLDELPNGLDTQVGQRGESLSAGERQLVALLRARLANPELLLLDEATSAIDPALDMQLARALERLQAGRTSVTVAHRLATAEAADEILVFDAARIVQRGTHRRLIAEGGVYGRLHAAWAGV
ncbi:multidrug ABC transporter ATP-binding protein [Microbacterium sp. No. 7]|nr:multidrug ABC transporter ATP-binding protein [Microbacterium sp. No. 7]